MRTPAAVLAITLSVAGPARAEQCYLSEARFLDSADKLRATMYYAEPRARAIIIGKIAAVALSNRQAPKPADQVAFGVINRDDRQSAFIVLFWHRCMVEDSVVMLTFDQLSTAFRMLHLVPSDFTEQRGT